MNDTLSTRQPRCSHCSRPLVAGAIHAGGSDYCSERCRDSVIGEIERLSRQIVGAYELDHAQISRLLGRPFDPRPQRVRKPAPRRRVLASGKATRGGATVDFEHDGRRGQRTGRTLLDLEVVS